MGVPHPQAGSSRPSRLVAVAIIPLLGVVLCLRALAGGALPWRFDLPWVPSLGVALSLHVDGLALLFLLLITFVGTLVFVYAASYSAGDPHRVRLILLLLVFMLAMIGAVTAESLLALYVFWELTSVVSFLLVGYKHEQEGARRAAQQALLVTAGGGLVLLAGFILLGEIAGSYSIQAIVERGPELSGDPRLPFALACLFVGAFTKSAQWPFHFWLPNAMAAPTPVSAYLHSATMVKLGVYLLARFKPAFGDLPLWELTLVPVGALTALWAMLLALRERDLKRILAWSTVAGLGTLVLLVGLPGPGAAAATAVFLVAHALYKAPLFFVAGNVDHCTGTRSIDRLAGMGPRMPWTALAALLAGASMAGVPLSFGYVAKDLIKIAEAEGEAVAWATHAILLVSALTVAAAAVGAIRVFWHRGGETLPSEVHEASPLMIAAPLAAAGLGVVFGLVPRFTDPLIGLASAAMGAAADVTSLRAGPVPTPEKFVTPTVLGAGLLIFLTWDRLHRLLEQLSPLDALGPSAWYTSLLGLVPRLAAAVTTRLQDGRLTSYVRMCLGFTLAALAAAWVASGGGPWPAWSTASLATVGAAGAIVAASIAVCLARDPFVMLLASGLSGVGAGVLFLFLGAPDLALTQFTVEVAFVMIVAAVILRVRHSELPPAPAGGRLGRLAIALPVGVVVAALLLTASAGPLDLDVPRFYGERSVPAAHGRNVVNVVIVDFRALDTLGEISVVAVTFLGALPLLALLARRRATRDDPR